MIDHKDMNLIGFCIYSFNKVNSSLAKYQSSREVLVDEVQNIVPKLSPFGRSCHPCFQL